MNKTLAVVVGGRKQPRKSYLILMLNERSILGLVRIVQVNKKIQKYLVKM